MIDLFEIAKEYKIKLHQVERGDKFCKANDEGNYINASYCAFQEIWLGIYEDEELKILSFFHELGHLTDEIDWSIDADDSTEHKAEAEAWRLGYKLAASYGVIFSDRAIKWAKKCLESYKK